MDCLSEYPIQRTESSYDTDRKYTDRFESKINAIVGQIMAERPSAFEDQKHNTDMFFHAARWSYRMRRWQYFREYPDDFTIRFSRPNEQTRCEMQKLLEGWGDFLFYGFADINDLDIHTWRAINLAKLAEYINQYVSRNGRMPGRLIPNVDKSSEFRAFNVRQWPRDLVYAYCDPRPAIIFTNQS